jgi:serine/threonine protein phosphatase PrpC
MGVMINLTVYGQTDIGLVRSTNEDAFVIADLTSGNVVQQQTIVRFQVGERGVLLAVSDGMGGASAGEVASAMVVESMRRSMTMVPSSEPSNALVERAAVTANREVWTAARQPDRAGMGATLTALYLHGTAMHIAEVGDSRAYLLRGGVLQQVTRDQSYAQVLLEAGALTPEQAAFAPLQNVILQAMGTKPDVSVALGRLELRQRDCFLLCSDGLSKLVSAEEMRQVILAAPRMDAACATLVELAKQRGGDDNITVLIGGVSGDLPLLVAGETIADTLQILQETTALGPPAASGA